MNGKNLAQLCTFQNSCLLNTHDVHSRQIYSVTKFQLHRETSKCTLVYIEMYPRKVVTLQRSKPHRLNADEVPQFVLSSLDNN